MVVMFILAWVAGMAKFHNLKSAFIHIEMDISFFKIGSNGFPDFCLRVSFFNGLPGGNS